jgi:hypothetical protein
VAAAIVTLENFPSVHLLLFTTFYCCSVVTVQHFNTVFLLTLESSSGASMFLFLFYWVHV